MQLTTKQTAILAAAIIVAVVGGLAVHAYIGSRVDMAKLDAIQQEVKIANDKSDALAKSAEQDRVDAQKRDVERTLQLSQTLAAIAVQKQQPVTLEQVASMIAARVPEAKVTPQELSQLPDAPSAAKGIRDYMLTCDECSAERDSLKQGISNANLQVKDLTIEKQAAVDEKAGVDRELAAAKKAIKGTFWTHLRDCSIRVGVGSLAGGLSGSGKIAGAGAGIGLGSCFLTR